MSARVALYQEKQLPPITTILLGIMIAALLHYVAKRQRGSRAWIGDTSLNYSLQSLKEHEFLISKRFNPC